VDVLHANHFCENSAESDASGTKQGLDKAKRGIIRRAVLAACAEPPDERRGELRGTIKKQELSALFAR